MTDLKKPDLSKDTTGPFVIDGEVVTYVRLPFPERSDEPHLLQRADGTVFWASDSGRTVMGKQVFLAPKEPKAVIYTWPASNPPVRIAYEVADDGAPVDGSVVRRVE